MTVHQALILVYEELYGDGLRPRGPLTRAVLRHKSEIREIFIKRQPDFSKQSQGKYYKLYSGGQPVLLLESFSASCKFLPVVDPDLLSCADEYRLPVRYVRVNSLQGSLTEVLKELSANGFTSADSIEVRKYMYM